LCRGLGRAGAGCDKVSAAAEEAAAGTVGADFSHPAIHPPMQIKAIASAKVNFFRSIAAPDKPGTDK
jgi:hypothetical protein